MLTRKCYKCEETKPITDFPKNSHNRSGYAYGSCKLCASKRMQAWRKDNPQKHAAHVSAWRRRNPEKVAEYQAKWRQSNPRAAESIRLKSLYGISLDEYEALHTAQNGLCAICKTDKPKRGRDKQLFVDHCHETKHIRGLLCNHCNAALGYFNHSPELLQAAIAYLTRR